MCFIRLERIIVNRFLFGNGLLPETSQKFFIYEEEATRTHYYGNLSAYLTYQPDFSTVARQQKWKENRNRA